MASKKTGRLAGLAALAGAAYLASKGKGEGKVAPDRDDADRYTGSRAPKEAEAAMPDMGEDERPAPTGMGAATELVAPRRVAPVKAPAARASGSGGGRGPAVGEEAAYKASRPAVSVGGSGGGRGPAVGEEAAYKAAGPRGSGMGSSITNRPDPRAPSIYAGEEAWAKYRELQKADKGMKRGGAVKKMASGGMTSKRGDGIASKGKTRCKMY